MSVISLVLDELAIANWKLVFNPANEVTWFFDHPEPAIWEVVADIAFRNLSFEIAFNNYFILNEESSETMRFAGIIYLSFIDSIAFIVNHGFDLIIFHNLLFVAFKE